MHISIPLAELQSTFNPNRSEIRHCCLHMAHLQLHSVLDPLAHHLEVVDVVRWGKRVEEPSFFIERV